MCFCGDLLRLKPCRGGRPYLFFPQTFGRSVGRLFVCSSDCSFVCSSFVRSFVCLIFSLLLVPFLYVGSTIQRLNIIISCCSWALGVVVSARVAIICAAITALLLLAASRAVRTMRCGYREEMTVITRVDRRAKEEGEGENKIQACRTDTLEPTSPIPRSKISTTAPP